MITIGDLNGAKNLSRPENNKVYPVTKKFINDSMNIIVGSSAIVLGIGIVITKSFDFFCGTGNNRHDRDNGRGHQKETRPRY